MTASHHEKLARLVEELHQELAATSQVDASLRAALETIVKDIRRLQPAAPPPAAEQVRSPSDSGPAVQGSEHGHGAMAVPGRPGGVAAPRTAAAAEEQPSRHTLIDRLRETADAFEGEHPNLAALLGSIIDALQGMGI